MEHYYDQAERVRVGRAGAVTLWFRRNDLTEYHSSAKDQPALSLYKAVWDGPGFSVGLQSFEEFAFVVRESVDSLDDWIARALRDVVTIVARLERLGRPIATEEAAVAFSTSFRTELQLPIVRSGVVEFLAVRASQDENSPLSRVVANFRSGSLQIRTIDQAAAER